MSENHAQPTIEDPVAAARADAEGGAGSARVPAEILDSAAQCKCSTCWDGDEKKPTGRQIGPFWVWLTVGARVVALLAIRSMGRLTKANRGSMTPVRKAVIAGIESDPETGQSEWVAGHVPLADRTQAAWLQTALENITSDSYKPVVVGQGVQIELTSDNGEGEEELRLKLEALIAAHPEEKAEAAGKKK